MIHTDEDDEFDRIERENNMRRGQPYHWELKAIQSAINIEREACARLAEKFELPFLAEAIRERKKL
jgi:hypothetical protein